MSRRMHVQALVFVALLAASVLAGFSSWTGSASELSGHGRWLMYQETPAHQGVLASGPATKGWVRRLGGRINGGLAIVDGVLYVDSFDHKLYAIDQRTGAVKWSASADNVLMSTPVVSDGVVIVGSGTSGWLKPDDFHSQVWGRPQGDDVLAFSTADGHLLWKVHTVGEDMPSPAIDGDHVVFANGDAHAYALDLHDGRAFWTRPLPGIATMASATVDRGVVFFSTCHNAPYVCETRAMEVQTGRTLWTSPEGGSDCTPTIGDHLVFVNGSRDDTAHFHTGGSDIVAALDERTGKTVWKWESPPGPYTFPSSNERQIAGTYDGGVLYQPIGQDSRVLAFNARTGKILWNRRTWAGVKMSPAVTKTRVYFGDVDGILYNLDRRTGAIVHTSSYLKPFSTSPPIIAGDMLYIALDDIVLATPVKDV
jgi:outer membrane protein assembly factor BamB